MNEKKRSVGLIVVVVMLITLMLCGGCLFVLSEMGYVRFGKDDNELKLKNKNVDDSDLNEVLDILGLFEYYNGVSGNNECLNYYISKNNFRENSDKVLGWYVIGHQLGTMTGQTEIIRDVDGDGIADIDACGGAADCGSIKIEDANKIIRLYKLSYIDEYLEEMPDPYKNSEYLINYYNLTGIHPYMCNIKTAHNLTVEYDKYKNIIVVDNQNVVEYELYEEFVDEHIKTNKEQVVKYTLKKENNSYYLDNVVVE